MRDCVIAWTSIFPTARSMHVAEPFSENKGSDEEFNLSGKSFEHVHDPSSEKIILSSTG